MNKYTYIYINIYTHMYVYIYKYIHTYIHTYPKTNATKTTTHRKHEAFTASHSLSILRHGHDDWMTAGTPMITTSTPCMVSW